jgi:NADH-quinone oxidoreductase subunit M
MIVLFIVAAGVVLVGQGFKKDRMPAAILTLLLLGLSLGAVASGGATRVVFLAMVMGVTGLMLVKRAGSCPLVRGSLGVGSVGMACLMASLWATPPVATVLQVIGYATVLPLFPFHGLFVGAVAHLPASVAAFAGFALPFLGFIGLGSVGSALPAWMRAGLFVSILLGAFYGVMKLTARHRVDEQVAYLGVILLAVPWWHLSVAGNAAPAALYVTAIALALLGLRLAAGFLQARFGHLDIDKMRGLARPMPRFATLLTLLMMAVMGLPLFGVFSGFMALLLGPSSFGAAGLAGVVVLWFLASWLMTSLLQRLLFGPPRMEVLYRDLTWLEVCSLAVLLVVLAAGAITPADGFGIGHGPEVSRLSRR